MKGMKEAAERIKQAISQQEQIMIYGDYDADGVTSTSVMRTHCKSCRLKLIFIYLTALKKDMALMNRRSVRLKNGASL